MKLSSSLLAVVVLGGLSALYIVNKDASATGHAVVGNPGPSAPLMFVVIISVALLGVYFISKYLEK